MIDQTQSSEIREREGEMEGCREGRREGGRDGGWDGGKGIERETNNAPLLTAPHKVSNIHSLSFPGRFFLPSSRV